MTKPKLHEIICVAGDRSAAASAVLEETKKVFDGKPDHFLAKFTQYVPFDEKDANTAEETHKELVTTVAGKLKHCFGIVGKAVDVQAAMDITNCSARAVIEIDGQALTPELPAVTLLWLESQLKKWLEVMLVIPTLAPGKKWQLDPDKGSGVYVDVHPDAQFRSHKVPKSKILVDATEHHPAQVSTWNEDEKIGKVLSTTWSSMASPADKSALISRVQDLMIATKQARQRANSQEVVQLDIAKSLVKFILGQ